MTGFWSGGPAAYERALTQQLREEIRELRKRCAPAAPDERLESEREIARLQAVYQSRLADLGTSLF